MTFAAPPGGRPAGRTPKKPSPLVLTIIAVAVLLVLFVIFAQVYTEVLWFDQLGVLSVYATEWIAKAVLFVIGFLVMAVPVWFCLRIAHRNRPVYAPVTPRQENLDRYREAVEPLRRAMPSRKLATRSLALLRTNRLRCSRALVSCSFVLSSISI